jgi:hypothetical protein
MGMSGRLLRPKATGFNPSSIGSLQLWLDGAAAETITTVSGAVSQWNSKVGGVTATQTTANNRPEYRASGMNGKGALYFDGTNDQLNTTFNANSLSGYVTYAIAVIPDAAMVDTKANFEAVLFARGSSANGVHVNTSSTPKRWTASYRNALYNSTVGGAVAASSQIVLATIDATTFTVRVNGTQGTQAGTFASGSNESDAIFQVGRDGATGRYFPGVIAEILLYSRTLTASELSSVEKYLAQKWGVTLT